MFLSKRDAWAMALLLRNHWTVCEFGPPACLQCNVFVKKFMFTEIDTHAFN